MQKSILLAVLALIPISFAHAQIPTAEREALIALYNSTDGANWSNNNNWLGAVDTECTWSGVTCGGGHVEELSLTYNQLSGSIPPELGNLSSLINLYLYWNQLSGAIPPELGNLSNLTILDLYSNQLSGGIPPELGSLSNLQRLGLVSNQLTGSIPPELGNMSDLTYLYLYSNQLSGSIPSELEDLSSLRLLYLNNNQLSGGIPPELGNLSNLAWMFLGDNQLTGAIPSELGNMSNLQRLGLESNQLSGAIPPELGNLSNLRILDLGANQLSGGIPPELGSLSNLQRLGLESNQLSGGIPPELGQLSKLSWLNLTNSDLTGSIPPELGNLSSLEWMFLTNNQLTGAIPSELGDLSKLVGLDLGFNQLSGSIPPELGKLSLLQQLYLYSNKLSGDIPAELEDLTALLDSSGWRIKYNALHSDNATLIAFLNSKHPGGEWQSTQTIAPVNLSVDSLGNHTVWLSWDAVTYTADPGGYEILFSTTSGGPYTSSGRTSSKQVNDEAATGLSPDTVYYFVIRTVTDPHVHNQNTVTSGLSTEVSARTAIENIDCTDSISPVSETFGSAGGTGLVNVSTQADCTWTVTSVPSWVTINSGTSHTGPGTVDYAVAENTGDTRSDNINIGGKDFLITQRGGNLRADFSMSNTSPEIGEVVTFSVDSALEVASWDFGEADCLGNKSNISCQFLPAGACNTMEWAYPSAGEKTVTMVLTDERFKTKYPTVQNSGSCEPSFENFVIAAAISSGGVNDTRWESDFRFFNPCSFSLDVNLVYQPDNESNSTRQLPSYLFSLGPSETRVFPSARDFLNEDEVENINGSILIDSVSTSGCKVLSVSKTFNDTPEGTLGLFVPAMRVTSIGVESLDLTGLIRNNAYRSNLRLVNHGDKESWVEITVFNKFGETLTEGKSVLVKSRSTRQINDVAGWAGVDEVLSQFTVLAEVKTPGAIIDGFATVIDNISGDSVMIASSYLNEPMIWLPGVVYAPGKNETFWQTDIWFHNPNPDDPRLTSAATYVDGGNIDLSYVFEPPEWPEVESMGLRRRLNIAGSILGDLGVETTSGYLVFEGLNGDSAPQIAARTFTGDDHGGTYGLHLPSFGSKDLLQAGDVGHIVGVSNSADELVGFRTNLAMLATGKTAEVEVTFFYPDGTQAPDQWNATVWAGQLKQTNNVFKKFGLGSETVTGTFKIEVLSGGDLIIYATEIDNRTGDSIFIPAQQKVFGASAR